MFRIYIVCCIMHNRVWHYKILMDRSIVRFLYYCIHIKHWTYWNYVFFWYVNYK